MRSLEIGVAISEVFSGVVAQNPVSGFHGEGAHAIRTRRRSRHTNMHFSDLVVHTPVQLSFSRYIYAYIHIIVIIDIHYFYFSYLGGITIAIALLLHQLFSLVNFSESVSRTLLVYRFELFLIELNIHLFSHCATGSNTV